MTGLLLAAAVLALPANAAGEAPVYLIGIDAATWELADPLLEAGRLPTLEKLIGAGCAARLKTDDPGTNSGIIWTSIATGKTKDKHGVRDWDLEQGPPLSTNRKVKALWNILSEHGKRVLLSYYMGTWPVEPVNGVMISKRWKSAEHYPKAVYPADAFAPAGDQAARALLTEWPNVSEDFPAPPNSTQARRREQLRTLGESLSDDEAAVRIAEHFLSKGGFDFFAIHLWGLDRVQHQFLETPGGALADRTVVDRYYERVDALVARLVRKAPDGATFLVLSDHGAAAVRPALERVHGRWLPSGEHMDTGMLVVSGAGAGRCAERGSAVTLDVAPTVLHLLGLPVADDMDGEPLLRYLGARPASTPVRRLATYEDGRAKSAVAPKLAPAPKELDMLKRMGYIR